MIVWPVRMKVLEITSKDGANVVRFEWRMNKWGSTYDHRIIARAPQIEEEFKFGGCARFGLRKVHRFFGDAKVRESGHGFQNPQIMTYDLKRNESGFISLTVEDSYRSEPFHFDLGCDSTVRGWKEDVEGGAEQ